MSEGWEVHVGRSPSDDDFLFVDDDGKPYREHDADEFRSELKAAGAGTEINGEPLIRYSLRHTGSTEALKAGVRSEARDRLLGHKPRDTKGQHYEEPDLRYLSDEINKIPGFLAESEDGASLGEDEEPQVWSRIWLRDAAEPSSKEGIESDATDTK